MRTHVRHGYPKIQAMEVRVESSKWNEMRGLEVIFASGDRWTRQGIFQFVNLEITTFLEYADV
jgi:hypothetical protein